MHRNDQERPPLQPTAGPRGDVIYKNDTGRTLLRAIAVLGLVLGGLLLVAGLPRGVDTPISGDRPVSLRASAAMASSDAVRAPDGMVASTVAESDAWADDVSFAAALPPVPLRMSRSRAGFHPRGRAVATAWNTNPPHRPPRHA